jgi:hypothetical protein
MGTVDSHSEYACACGRPIHARALEIACPACGGFERVRHIRATDTVALSLDEDLRARQRPTEKHKGSSGRKRRVYERDVEHARSDDGVRRRVVRMVDRVGKLYDELITDEATGAVYSHVSEPLDEHRGHGSDKRKR